MVLNDRALREVQRAVNRAESAVMVHEFGRKPHNPRRRMAPLNDSYDALTNWLVIAFVLGCLVCMGVGFGYLVLQAERLVRS